MLDWLFPGCKNPRLFCPRPCFWGLTLGVRFHGCRAASLAAEAFALATELIITVAALPAASRGPQALRATPSHQDGVCTRFATTAEKGES